jgi:hypothetical protein
LSMNEMANEAKQPLTIETTSICNRNWWNLRLVNFTIYLWN